MKKRLIWFGLSLLLPLFIFLGQAPVLSLQGEFQEARLHYHRAVEETKTRLTDLSEGLRKDPTLIQHIEWSSFSAAGRILSGFVQVGRIDQLALVDQNCQLLATADQGLPLTSECPIPSWQDFTAPAFQWKMTSEAPQLKLVTPLTQIGDRRYFLIASTELREAWLFSFPELRKSFADRQLHLATEKGAMNQVLVEKGGVNSNGIRIDLYSTDPWLLLFPQLLHKRTMTLELPLLAALAVSGFALFQLVRSLREREKKLQETLMQLSTWAQELAPETDPSPSTQAGAQVDLETIRDRMSRMAKRSYETIQRCQHQNQLMQQQLVSLESRLMEKQAEQSWLHQARSLHQQMVGVARSHIQKMYELQSLGEDLSHLAAHELARPAQRLFDISSKWDNELTQVSARKFVRSLSERVDEQGISELEHHLTILLQQSHDIHNQAINLTILTQKLLQELKQNLHIAEHWHQLMGARDDSRRNLLELLQDSQSLVQLREQPMKLRFENLIDPSLSLEHLKIPTSTLTSTFYHCHLALIEVAAERAAQTAHATAQVKKRDDKLVLVLSIKGDWDEDLMASVQLPPRGEQHLYLAMQLIQGYGLKITQLPALQGMQALALVWEPCLSMESAVSSRRTGIRDDGFDRGLFHS